MLVSALFFCVALWVSWPNPGPKRFWDERYLAANTARQLTDGWPSRQNVYYPGLGHLPTALILDLAGAAGVEEAEIVASRRELGPFGYRMARAVNCAWGALGIWFVFLAGRRLAGPGAGLVAAGLLGLTPWYLRQAVIYKPDIALAALVAVSLWCFLRLDEKPSWTRGLSAWTAAALAVSAKWNAAPLIVPLTWASYRALRQPTEASSRPSALRRFVSRPWTAVALAGILFLAINPALLLDPEAYQRDLGETASHYAGQAEEGARVWDMPLHALRSLGGSDYLGLVAGLLAALGFVLALIDLRRSTPDGHAEPESGGWIYPLLWVITYVAVYSVATRYMSPHNWLPLLPAVVLFAALALVRLGRGSRGRQALTVGLALAAMLPMARESSRFVVRQAVPETRQRAEALLRARLGDLEGREVESEVTLHSRLQSFATQGRTLAPRAPRLLTLKRTPDELRDTRSLSDARFWYAEAADCAPIGAPRPSPEVIAIESGLLTARGRSACLQLHRWSLAETSTYRFDGPDAGSLSIPWTGSTDTPDSPGAGASGSPALSVEVNVAGGPAPAVSVLLRTGSTWQEVPCHPLRPPGRRLLCRTARVPRADEIALRLAGPARSASATVRSWVSP